MEHKIIKTSFVGFYKKQYDFQKSSCVLPISVGKKYHEGENLKATIDMISQHFKYCMIVVCDSLQRHTLTAFSKIEIKQTEDLHAYAALLGTQWINRNQEIINQFKIPFKITRWDDWRNHSVYKKQNQLIEMLYKTNEKFRFSMHHSIGDFLDRCKKRMGDEFDYKTLFPASLQYFKEECAIMPLWAKEGINYEIYPGKRPDVMVLAHEYFVRPNHLLTWLNLRFRVKTVQKEYVGE